MTPRPYVVLIECVTGPREWGAYPTRDLAEREAQRLRMHGLDARATEAPDGHPPRYPISEMRRALYWIDEARPRLRRGESVYAMKHVASAWLRERFPDANSYISQDAMAEALRVTCGLPLRWRGNRLVIAR